MTGCGLSRFVAFFCVIVESACQNLGTSVEPRVTSFVSNSYVKVIYVLNYSGQVSCWELHCLLTLGTGILSNF